MSRLDILVFTQVCLRMAGLLAILFGVLVGGQAAIFLGRGIPIEGLAELLWPIFLLSSPLVLPLAVGSAVLLTYGNLHRAGSLQALASGGVRPQRALLGIIPLVLLTVLTVAYLAHQVLPQAMGGLRTGRDRLLSAAIASIVADRKPFEMRDGAQVFIHSAAGGKLQGLIARLPSRAGLTVITAPRGQWGHDEGELWFSLEDVVVVRREGSTTTTVSLPRWVLNPSKEVTASRSPDTLPTSALWALIDKQPSREDRRAMSTFNNARLAVWMRIMMPVMVLALVLFAAGLGLVAGVRETVVGVGVIAIVVVAMLYPSIAYTKSSVSSVKLHPLWLILPPLLSIAGWGLWMILRAGRPGTLLPRRSS